MHPNPPRWAPRPTLALAAVAILAAVLTLPGAARPAAGQDPLPYSLSVSKTAALEDGESIDVLLEAHPGFAFGLNGRIRICRDGETYAAPADLDAQQGKCPDVPLSSSGSLTPVLYAAPDGSIAFRTFQVGIGTVQWGPGSDPTRFSLTCDATHPCRLVIDIADAQGLRRIVDSSTLLTFDDGSATSGCSGSSPDAIATGGPDRMSGAWVTWTRAACLDDPAGRAPTSGVFAGEGAGQAAFQTGFADLTYSAVGPTFDPVAAPPTRSSVSVPVALNAAVIAVIGGYPNIAPDWPAQIPKRFEHLSVTIPEMATLFGSSPFAFEITYEDALRQRNPELAVGPLLSTAKSVPMAPAGSDATTWFATRAFDTQAPNEWVSSPIAIDGNIPNAPRGVYDSLAQADPPFSIAFLELYSSLAQLKKAAYAEYGANYGPIWVLTDFGTAQELGLTTVAIPNSSGAFIEPTADSLRAAVPDLELQADGTYLPPVTTTSPGAYPLTFVEHAVAPTEPLLDESCVPRTGAQQQLHDWLAFLTGPGQDLLTDAMVPLTPELAAQAATAQAQVGTAAVTGTCAPAAETIDPPDAPGAPAAPAAAPGALPTSAIPSAPPGGPSTGVPSGSSGPSAGGLGSTAFGGEGGLADSAGGTGGTGGDASTDDLAIAEIAYPEPTGGGAANGVATALALVVLAVLVAVGGMLSSGRGLRRPGGPS